MPFIINDPRFTQEALIPPEDIDSFERFLALFSTDKNKQQEKQKPNDYEQVERD